jgi:acyl-CoA synthetase (AMP-forming)/AMP-acid ligase II/acyl carrier protein
MKTKNIIEIIQNFAKTLAEKTAYVFLEDGTNIKETLTYGQLDQRVRIIAAYLQQNCLPGDRVLLLFSPGLEYITAFFACMYAKVIAVPSYPPDPTNLHRSLQRLNLMISDSSPTMILSEQSVIRKIKSISSKKKSGQDEFNISSEIDFSKLYQKLMSITWVATDNLPTYYFNQFQDISYDPDDIVLLQYTSGSTGDPKGVCINHRNLMHNMIIIAKTFPCSNNDTICSWLPIYHDMGLIGGVIYSVYAGTTLYMMTPAAFLQRPVRWFKAISKYQCKLAFAPNFGYELCVRKIQIEDCHDIDLTDWKYAGNAAEPVFYETIESFSQKFKAIGFQMKSFCPCYGLAEATLMVSSTHFDQLPVYLNISNDQLEKLKLAKNYSSESKILVSSGEILPVETVIIVNTKGVPCKENEVGEIWVASESVAQGYWQKKELSQNTFQAQTPSYDDYFLRTGDSGFFNNGHLYVTGRIKDMIIIRGQNIYPQDIEKTSEMSHQAIRPGCCAAFSVIKNNEEQLVVVQEVRKGDWDFFEISDNISHAITKYHGIVPYAVVLIPPKTIAKTSSGKIRRHFCKNSFLKEKLSPLYVKKNEFNDIVDKTMPSTEKIKSYFEILHHLCLGLSKIISIHPEDMNLEQPLLEQGLDSVAIIELMRFLEETYQVHADTDLLEQYPSLSKLARYLSSKNDIHNTINSKENKDKIQNEQYTQKLNAITPEELFFLQLINENPDQSFYNMHNVFQIDGNLNISILEESIAYVINRHDIFRTCFQKTGEQFERKVFDKVTWKLDNLDISQSDNNTMPELKSRIDSIINQNMPYTQAPMLAASIIKISKECYMFVIKISHLIIDGTSAGIILSEISHCYNHMINNKSPDLPEVLLQSKEYAKKRSQIDIRFHQPTDIETPVLPFDFENSDSNDTEYQMISHTISEKQMLSLKEIANKNNADLSTLMLTCFQYSLYLLTGKHKIDVLIAYHNRNNNNQNIVSCLACSPSYSIEILDEDSISSMLLRGKKNVYQCLKNCDDNFYVPPRSSILFNYHDYITYQQALKLDHLEIKLRSDLKKYYAWNIFSIVLGIYPKEKDNLYLIYDPSKYKHDTIEKLLQTYLLTLENILKADKNES